jgi:SAM-dependent methyltransferase
MNLSELRQAWNDLASKDAMWAVLTGPYGAARAWDEDAFFRTGVAEIESVLDRLRGAGMTPRFDRALDFGCGVGRLTQALGRHFNRADGVDIASTMIERAEALNRLGDRCVYHLNETDDLSLFSNGLFDFVYSRITLQHMEARYSRRYIAEFLRVIRPGGVVMFQIPGEPTPVEPPRTRNSATLPRTASRAAIEAPPALRCAPGAVLPLRIRVRNEGTHAWSTMGDDDGRYSIRLGTHWRGRFGWMLRFDDVRTALTYDLAPGESLEMGINPEAPRKPGRYILEFDMVQEEVRWFADTGSRCARTRVHVDPALPPGEVRGLPPLIEMHGIPRHEIETLIVQSGGTVLAVDDDSAPGSGWTSYRYVASR